MDAIPFDDNRPEESAEEGTERLDGTEDSTRVVDEVAEEGRGWDSDAAAVVEVGRLIVAPAALQACSSSARL